MANILVDTSDVLLGEHIRKLKAASLVVPPNEGQTWPRGSSPPFHPRRALALPRTSLFAVWDSRSITGLSDGDPVTTWPDHSGHGYDLTSSGSARPLWRTGGGPRSNVPYVDFDGTDDYMVTASLPEMSSKTAYVLWKPDETGYKMLLHQTSAIYMAQAEWVFYAGGARTITGQTVVAGTYYLDCLTSEDSKTSGKVRGYKADPSMMGFAKLADEDTGTPSTVGGPLALGAMRDTGTTYYPLNGRILWAAIYAADSTAALRQEVFSYVRQEFGL